MKRLRSTHALDALRERNYRLLWFSTLLTSGAMQMETVILSWYILQVTGSPFLVGLLTAFRMGANIFGAVAGALADRMSRKHLILADQGIMTFAAVAMIGLVATGAVQPWHVFAAAAITGLARVFDQPARQALVADSVPLEKVGNAIGLNMVGMNAMWAVGPLLAGVVYASLGPKGGYASLAICYSMSGAFMAFVRIRTSPQNTGGESVLRSMLTGISYVRKQGILVSALLMAAIANLTAFPFLFTLLPVFARKTLQTDATGFGLLMSGVGVGTIIGAVVVTLQPDLRYMGRLMAVAMVAWHLTAIVVVFTEAYALVLPLVVFSGTMQSISMATIAALLLGTIPAQYRGRVMGLRALAVYPLPIGSTIIGWLIGVMGVSATTVASAVFGSILVATVVALLPITWKRLTVPAAQPQQALESHSDPLSLGSDRM